MTAATVSALALTSALAQSTTTTPPAAPAPSTQATPAAPSAGEHASFVARQTPDQWLASKFRGTDVIGANEEKIGDVSDILFDKDGRILAYVVGVGGFLGIGAKDVAIAPASFQLVPGKDASDYLEARLAPDMYNLIRQVQVSTDMAKGCGGRLAGAEIPKFEDTETSFAELQDRLTRAVTFLKGLDRSAFDGAEDKAVTLKFPNAEFHFNGRDYLNNFAMPNVYFHITTAYAILRHKGVPLGKPDFLGRRS